MGKRILCQFNRHKWRHRQSVTLSLSLSPALSGALIFRPPATHFIHAKKTCVVGVCVQIQTRTCHAFVHAQDFVCMPHFSSRFFFLLAFCTMSACICMAHSEWTEWRMVKTAAILCKFFFSFALFFFEPLDQDYSLYNVFAFYSVGTAFIFLLFFLFVCIGNHLTLNCVKSLSCILKINYIAIV